MTRRILSALIVLLAFSVVGVSPSQAQDKGPSEKAAKQKNENAQKKNARKNDPKADKLDREKALDLKHKQVRAERAQGKTADGKRMKQNAPGQLQRVDGKPEMRRVSEKKEKGLQHRGADRGRVKARLKQYDHELQKHAKRLATIDRLVEISEKNGNKKLAERAGLLKEKESERHERRIAKLKSQPVRIDGAAKPTLLKRIQQRELVRPAVQHEKVEDPK